MQTFNQTEKRNITIPQRKCPFCPMPISTGLTKDEALKAYYFYRDWRKKEPLLYDDAIILADTGFLRIDNTHEYIHFAEIKEFENKPNSYSGDRIECARFSDLYLDFIESLDFYQLCVQSQPWVDEIIRSSLNHRLTGELVNEIKCRMIEGFAIADQQKEISGCEIIIIESHQGRISMVCIPKDFYND